MTATDPIGNGGTSGVSTINVTKSDLIVDGLATYNGKGDPTTTFSPGDTIFPFFRLRYSSGAYITSGQYRVAIENPGGREIANLTATYDSSKFGFDTTTGYPVSSSDPGGSWAVAIDSGSINDGFGNTGPSFTTALTV